MPALRQRLHILLVSPRLDCGGAHYRQAPASGFVFLSRRHEFRGADQGIELVEIEHFIP